MAVIVAQLQLFQMQALALLAFQLLAPLRSGDRNCSSYRWAALKCTERTCPCFCETNCDALAPKIYLQLSKSLILVVQLMIKSSHILFLQINCPLGECKKVQSGYMNTLEKEIHIMPFGPPPPITTEGNVCR